MADPAKWCFLCETGGIMLLSTLVPGGPFQRLRALVPTIQPGTKQPGFKLPAPMRRNQLRHEKPPSFNLPFRTSYIPDGGTYSYYMIYTRPFEITSMGMSLNSCFSVFITNLANFRHCAIDSTGQMGQHKIQNFVPCKPYRIEKLKRGTGVMPTNSDREKCECRTKNCHARSTSFRWA